MGRSALAVLPADQDGDKRGRRYDQPMKDAAFSLYASLNPPSLARAATLLRIATSTLAEWSRRDGWQDRLAALKSEQVGSTISGAVQSRDALVSRLIAEGQVPSLIAYLEIVADREHRDRLEAARDLLAQGGRPVPKGGSATAILNQDGSASLRVKMDLSLFTSAELAAWRDDGTVPARFLPQGDTPTPTPHPDQDGDA